MARYMMRFKIEDQARVPRDEFGPIDLEGIGSIGVESPQQLGMLLRTIDSSGHLVSTYSVDKAGEESTLDEEEQTMVDMGMFPQ